MAVYQSLTLTELSQNRETNTSQLRILWQSTQTGGSYNEMSRQAQWLYSVNGSTEQSKTVSYTLPYQQTAVIADTVITVPHNDKGEASVTVRTYMDTHISAGVVELSKTVQLTQIPRPTTLTASDGVIGGISRIAVNRKHEAETHSIAYSFGTFAGYVTESGTLSETEVRMSSDSVELVLPADFYSQLPNSRQGVCTLTCCTYLGDTPIGAPQQATFTVRVEEGACLPEIWGTVRDQNEVTKALTGDDTVLIRGYSDGLCTVTAEAKNGASVRKITVDGMELTEDTVTVQSIEATPVFTVLDSRDYQVSATAENTVIPYKKPNCRAILERLHPTDGRALLQVSGDWFSGHFGLQENSLTLSCRVGAGQWQSMEVMFDGDSFLSQRELTGMDYTRVSTVTLRLTDALTETEKQLTLKKSIPVFDWGENDFAFHVPVKAEGGLSVSGKSLLDMMYPVGAVYISTAETDPGTLFGGTWEQLQDRFLLAAGGGYAAGSFGGEATHTLTVEELPAHDHKSYGWAYANSTDGNVALRADGASTDYGTRQTGGGQAHNNMPPYLAVYMWKRTA